jgi:cytochrome c-type biogenesis protein CcmH/NrfG
MLMLGALFTGIMCVAYAAMVPTKGVGLSIAANKRATFVLVGLAMLVIVGTTSGLYYLSRQVASVYTFSSALQGIEAGTPIATIEEQIARAYEQFPNELYALQVGAYQLAKINTLASVPELTQAQQQELQSSIRNAINAGQIAVASDPSDSQGWSLLGAVYSVLSGAGVEGAQDRAVEALTKARELEPKNPAYILRQAQLSAQLGDLAEARTKTQEAIALKRNYTDALLFLAQIDIVEGKVDDAIATTRAVTTLEPNNPARYYQLGVLLSANAKRAEAIDAFTAAVTLDPNYANARYLLALGLIEEGDLEGAQEQLQVVLELNPGNEAVTSLLEQLRTGVPVTTGAPNGSGVTEPVTVTTTDDTVTSTVAPDTPLVTPVNTVPEEPQQSQN